VFIDFLQLTAAERRLLIAQTLPSTYGNVCERLQDHPYIDATELKVFVADGEGSVLSRFGA
jgi:hypothetical protein